MFSASLSRWLNIQSVDFIVTGSVPKADGEHPRLLKGYKEQPKKGRPLKYVNDSPIKIVHSTAVASVSSSLQTKNGRTKSDRAAKKPRNANYCENLMETPEFSGNLESITTFSVKSYWFDVDVSPKTEEFETVQATGIYDTILKIRSAQAARCSKSPDICATVATEADPFNVRSIRRTRERAHVLFCGGPISAIRTCPRRTTNGLELHIDFYYPCNSKGTIKKTRKINK